MFLLSLLFPETCPNKKAFPLMEVGRLCMVVVRQTCTHTFSLPTVGYSRMLIIMLRRMYKLAITLCVDSYLFLFVSAKVNNSVDTSK